MKSPFTSLQNQSGQAIIYGAIFFMGILVMGGFAVDTANVFLIKSKSQRAADASTMAAITRYAQGLTDEETLETAAEEIARYNLNEMGLEDAEIDSIQADLTVDENRVATITLQAVVNVNTFFMRFIPGADLATIDVTVGASSRRLPAIISLVLDTSHSMICTGSCPEKLQALKDAANAFVDTFEDDLDEISLIHFNYRAWVLQPMAPVNKANLHNMINNLSASGHTNIAHGVTLGRQQIESVNNPEAVRAIVLFTDGAPNGLNAYFTNGKYSSHRNYPNWNPQYWNYLMEGIYRRVLNLGNLSQKCSSIGGCYNTFRYLDSRMNYVPNSQYVDRYSSYEIIQESFDLSVIESDYAKADGTTVYTIGLGDPDPSTTTAYQNISDFNSIKPILLRRIANDPAGKNDPQFPEYPNNSSHPSGIYFETPNPEDLTQIFEAIAQRLRLRLID